jgi:hypothetical protein
MCRSGIKIHYFYAVNWSFIVCGICVCCITKGGVAQLVKALCCKPEGRGLDPMVSFEFFIDLTMTLGSTQPLTAPDWLRNCWLLKQDFASES